MNRFDNMSKDAMARVEEIMNSTKLKMCIRDRLCAADSARWKLSGGTAAGSGLLLAEIKGEPGAWRSCRRYAADGF